MATGAEGLRQTRAATKRYYEGLCFSNDTGWPFFIPLNAIKQYIKIL